MTDTVTSIDCVDPGYGSENEDGYVRVLDKPRSVGGRLVMRHRAVWETFKGEIPKGYEIDHKCKNRRCCNVEHLQLLSTSEHRSKDNSERYKKDFEAFKIFYLERGGDIGSQWKVGKTFNRSQACISKWVIKIKQEIN